MGKYLDAVHERVVVFDGAMGTSIQDRNLTADDFGGPQFEGCNEILNVTRPDVIADIHRGFLEAGVDVVETNAFGAFSTVLIEYGIAERAYELSRAAADIAREVADSYDGDRWVAGNLGPGTKLPSLGQIRFGRMPRH